MSATKEVVCKSCRGKGTITVYVNEWAEMWERIRLWFRRVKLPKDSFDPGSPNYVGHTKAKAMGKARCTCATHGTWLIGQRKVDILCPFHGR
jgi:predicted methyltransferase